MNFQVTVATLSTTVGLSAFVVDAKEESVFPQQMEQRKMEVADPKFKDFAQTNGAIENVLKSISRGRAVSSHKTADRWPFTYKQQDPEIFDLGILGGNAKPKHQPDYRQLQVDPNKFADDYLQSAYENLYYAPLGTQIDAACTIFGVFGVSCSPCGTTPALDPDTGDSTGLYSVEMNCPALVPSASDYELENALEIFNIFCEDGYFCPGCKSVCTSCNVDVDNFNLSLQDCLVTDDLRVGITNARNEGYPMLLSAAPPSMTSTSVLTLALAGASVVSMTM